MSLKSEDTSQVDFCTSMHLPVKIAQMLYLLSLSVYTDGKHLSTIPPVNYEKHALFCYSKPLGQ